jgi:transcriptional regulator with XRE-family HTH domain
MSFGERVRQLRKEKGWTQRELADHADLDFTFLSKLENDKETASEKTIRSLATALGVEPEELITLAQKVPDSAREAMTATPSGRMFLRTVRGLTETDWSKLVKAVEGIKKKK